MMIQIALGVAVLALLAVAALGVRVARLQRRMEVLPEDGGIFEALRRLDVDLAANEQAVAALRPVVQSLHERMPGAICHAGVVLTLLARRTETLFFVKMVRAGRGMEPLSPEEEQVVARAMGV
jgi:hypothetical protein